MFRNEASHPVQSSEGNHTFATFSLLKNTGMKGIPIDQCMNGSTIHYYPVRMRGVIRSATVFHSPTAENCGLCVVYSDILACPLFFSCFFVRVLILFIATLSARDVVISNVSRHLPTSIWTGEKSTKACHPKCTRTYTPRPSSTTTTT